MGLSVNLGIESYLWSEIHRLASSDEWDDLIRFWYEHDAELTNIVGVFNTPDSMGVPLCIPCEKMWGDFGLLYQFNTRNILLLNKEYISQARSRREYSYEIDSEVQFDTNYVSHLYSMYHDKLQYDLHGKMDESIAYILGNPFSINWGPYLRENIDCIDKPEVLEKLSVLERIKAIHAHNSSYRKEDLSSVISSECAEEKALTIVGGVKKWSEKSRKSIRRKYALAYVCLLYSCKERIENIRSNSSAWTSVCNVLENLNESFPVFGLFELVMMKAFFDEVNLPFFSPIREPNSGGVCNVEKRLSRMRGVAWDIVHFRNLYSSVKFCDNRLMTGYLMTVDSRFCSIARNIRPVGVLMRRDKPGFEAIYPRLRIPCTEPCEKRLGQLMSHDAVCLRMERVAKCMEAESFLENHVTTLEGEVRKLLYER